MSINLEKASIILEMLSFFLVTIDLLGRKRIETLQHRFEKRMAVIKNLDLREVAVSQPLLTMDRIPGCAGTCVIFLIFHLSLIVSVGVWVIPLKVIGYLIGLEDCLMVLILPLSVFTAYHLSFFFRVLLRKVVYVIVGVLEKIVDGLFAVLLSLFYRLKLEGVMLVAGALLFLTSKILAYLNAGYK